MWKEKEIQITGKRKTIKKIDERESQGKHWSKMNININREEIKGVGKQRKRKITRVI